jgi:hypothetical protein
VVRRQCRSCDACLQTFADADLMGGFTGGVDIATAATGCRSCDACLQTFADAALMGGFTGGVDIAMAATGPELDGAQDLVGLADAAAAIARGSGSAGARRSGGAKGGSGKSSWPSGCRVLSESSDSGRGLARSAGRSNACSPQGDAVSLLLCERLDSRGADASTSG